MNPSKKRRPKRPPLTKIEVWRGPTLRLRVEMEQGLIDQVGDVLGQLLKRVTPGIYAKTAVAAPVDLVEPVEPVEEDLDFSVDPDACTPDDEHADVRARLTDLISGLCDQSLADALDVTRAEIARRAEGRN